MMLEKTREGNIIGFVSLDRNLILSAPSPAMLNTPPVSANLKRDPHSETRPQPLVSKTTTLIGIATHVFYTHTRIPSTVTPCHPLTCGGS